MGAPSKDAVYAALRERGIHAIKVTERIQPVIRKGFAGLRKRDFFSLVIGVLVVGSLVAWLLVRAGGGRLPVREAPPTGGRGGDELVLMPSPRHQIAGIGGVDIKAVFSHPSEAYLARFVQPGQVSGENGGEALSPALIDDLLTCLKSPIKSAKGESPTVVDIKRTVAGVKQEVALLLGSGRGVNDILAWLEERQKMEASHRARIVANCKRGIVSKEKTNQMLRTMCLQEVE